MTVIVEYSIRIAYTRIIEYPAHRCFPRHSMGTKRDLRRLLHLARKLKTRGKTRSADTCHEQRWSSPSLTSHFQPISRISSTFRVVLAIARFHAPSGRDWNWRSSWRQNKTKICTIAFDRDAYCGAARMLSSFIYGNEQYSHSASCNLFLVYSSLSRCCMIH